LELMDTNLSNNVAASDGTFTVPGEVQVGSTPGRDEPLIFW